MDSLTPDQERAIERIQLVAVCVLAAVVIGLRVLARSSVGNFWVIAAIALGALYLFMFVLVAFAARVEGMTYRSYVARLARRTVADLRRLPSRSKARAQAALDRLRHRHRRRSR